MIIWRPAPDLQCLLGNCHRLVVGVEQQVRLLLPQGLAHFRSHSPHGSGSVFQEPPPRVVVDTFSIVPEWHAGAAEQQSDDVALAS